MNPRIRLLLVGFAIGLQLADAVLLVVAHRHEHSACSLASHPAAKHRHLGRARLTHTPVCSHHHSQHVGTSAEEPVPGHSAPDQPHDDCALCRHASQPVALASLVVTSLASELVAPLALPVVASLSARPRLRSRSRAPPLGIA
jgi:hypothetical protein